VIELVKLPPAGRFLPVRDIEFTYTQVSPQFIRGSKVVHFFASCLEAEEIMSREVGSNVEENRRREIGITKWVLTR
jgi:hypothetical protein